jgi:uncharacterized membrane protein
VDAVPWIILAATGLVLLFVPIPKRIRESNKPKRFKKYPIAGAALGVVNELYQPSAANAAVIVEEQKVARKATPSPEDKHNRV